MHSGFFCIDKPPGITSHTVISKLRKILNMKKIGHAGTLDPMATGVLMVGCGTSTRLLDYVQAGMKEYIATIRFGEETNTGDAEGEIIHREDMSNLNEVELKQALNVFEGDIQQIPPMVSAIKVDGKKLYEYAREGKEVERKIRDVFIESIELESFETVDNNLQAKIKVRCQAGTYIRTLAQDIAYKLNGYAHLVALERTSNGTVSIEECISLDALEELDDPFNAMIHPVRALSHLPSVELSDDQTEEVSNGRKLILDENQGKQLLARNEKIFFCTGSKPRNLIAVYDFLGLSTPKLRCVVFLDDLQGGK